MNICEIDCTNRLPVTMFVVQLMYLAVNNSLFILFVVFLNTGLWWYLGDVLPINYEQKQITT